MYTNIYQNLHRISNRSLEPILDFDKSDKPHNLHEMNYLPCKTVTNNHQWIIMISIKRFNKCIFKIKGP